MERIKRILEGLGITDPAILEEIESWIEAGVDPEAALFEAVGPSAVEAYNEQSPILSDDPGAENSAVETEDEAGPTPYEVAQKVADGQELTAEEQLIVDQDPSSFARWLNNMQRSTILPQLSWMFNPQGGALAGIPLESIEWTVMFDMANEMYGDQITWPEYDSGLGLGLDDYKEQAVKDLLVTQDVAAVDLTRAYAESIGRSGTELRDGDWLVVELSAVENEYGLTRAEAKRLGQIGKSRGLEIGEMARLHSNLKANGVKITLPGTEKKTVARKPTEAEGRAANIGGTYIEGGPPRGTSYADQQAAMYQAYWDEWQGRRMADYADKFLDAKETYGSEIVANVAMFNTDLAERLYNDPYSLTVKELQEVDNLIQGAGKYELVDTAGASWLQNRLSGARDVLRVDKEGARDAARILAAAWNMPALTDSEVEAIANGWAAPQLAALKASRGNPFQPELDPTALVVDTPSPYAAAKKALRSTAEYQELFGNMRPGESEEEYAGRFNSEVQELLGDSDSGLSRAGMRTGDRRTVGQAILTSGAGSESSTFRKRLAQLGEAFRSET